jgi:hypothetical protein
MQLHECGLHGHGAKLAALCVRASHQKLCRLPLLLLLLLVLVPPQPCAELMLRLQVVFALDKDALKQLRAAGAHAFYIADVQLHAASQGDQGSAPLADLSTRSRQTLPQVLAATCSLLTITLPSPAALSEATSSRPLCARNRFC